jgi:hypothetical protein
MMDINFKKYAVITFIIFTTLIPILIFSEISNYNALENNQYTFSPDLNTSSFSADDYTPILDEPVQGLGNITVTKLFYHEIGLYNHSEAYPNLVDDLSSGALNITYLNTVYIETVKVAQFNNLDDSIPSSDTITVLLNESISVQYNTSIDNSEGFMIYTPRLFPKNLVHVFIQNQSDPDIVELTDNDYVLDSNEFIKFNYYNYFKTNFNNFSIYFIFEYDLEPQAWMLYQDLNEPLKITQQEQNFTPSFHYNFTFIGTKLTGNFSGSQITLADNLIVDLLIEPLDKDLLFDHALTIQDQEILDFLELDNTINVTMSGDAKKFSLSFKANFTLRFENPVDYSWAIDRLYEGRDIRQRIYLPSLIAGPEHIFLRDVTLLENTIIADQVVKNYSIFERHVDYFDIVEFITQETIENSLIFTENAVKRKGLELVIPYLIVGETNPCFINYQANNDLRIIITDNIRMPLAGYRVELFYFGKKYGTYISNDLIQPMAQTYSDENGAVLIENVPNGNYTVRIYQGNILISESLINTFREINYFQTDVIHFPFWILIFGGTTAVLFLIGLVSYFNNKKRS